MGAGNALLVVNRWSPYLNDKPFRALVQMALVSLDADLPPRYWAGWGPIARAVGAPFPDVCERGKHEGTPTESGRCTDCDVAQRAARRAVRGLVQVGVIRRTRRPAKGINAEYALLIGQMPVGNVLARWSPKAVDSADSGSTTDPCTRDSQRPVYTGQSLSPTRVSERPAKEEGGGVTGIDQESRSPLPGTSPGADGDLDVNPNPIPQPRNEPDLTECPYCQWRAWEGHAAGCRSG